MSTVFMGLRTRGGPRGPSSGRQAAGRFLFLDNREVTGEAREVEVGSHFLTVAAAGSGKGTAVLAPNLLGGWQGSCLVFDPKAELFWWSGAWRAQPVAEGGLGHRVILIDPFDEANVRYRDRLPPALKAVHPPVVSTSWNPLAGVSEPLPGAEHEPVARDYFDALGDLSEGLIRPSSREAHWDDSAKMLLRGLAAAVVELKGQGVVADGDPARAGEPSVRQVYALLRQPVAEWTATLLGTRDDKTGLRRPDGWLDRERFAYRTLARFGEDTNEVKGVISNALTQASFLEDARMLAALDTPMQGRPFRFGDLMRQPTTIYLVLPPEKFNERYGRWLRLLLQRALNEVMQTDGEGKVLFLLDEFGTIGPLPAVENAFGLARGRGVCLWPFIQDLNQFARDYPSSYQTMIANCTAELYFGINDLTTAEHVSKAWGDGDMGAFESLGVEVASTIGARQRARIVLPSEVMQATQGPERPGGRGDATMFLRSGGRFELLAPAHYWRHAVFSKRARPDPRFAGAG